MHNSSSNTQIELRHYTQDVLAHSHEHHQLVLPINGALEMDVEGIENTVMTNTAAIIPSGQAHSCASSGRNEFLIFDILEKHSSTRTSQNTLWQAASDNPFVKLDSSVQGYCHFLAHEMKLTNFSALDKSLSSSMLMNAISRSMGIRQEALPITITKAIEYMEQHLSNPITIADIARAAGASESRLHARFKTHFGISPKLYLTKLRLKHATALLKNTQTSIAEIAQSVGYGDQSAFTRTFQRQIGTSPAQYRQVS